MQGRHPDRERSSQLHDCARSLSSRPGGRYVLGAAMQMRGILFCHCHQNREPMLVASLRLLSVKSHGCSPFTSPSFSSSHAQPPQIKFRTSVLLQIIQRRTSNTPERNASTISPEPEALNPTWTLYILPFEGLI